MTLPSLYKQTKTGATQVCNISTIDNIITVEFGQLDGAMQTKTTTCKGKNIGKANETTDLQQAQSEAQSKWEKKKKSGYSEDISAPVTVQLPMKVGIWESKRFPETGVVYSTPKYNGVNGVYRRESNELKLYSRGGDEYPGIPHLEDEIHQIMDILDSNELNGELYIHNEHLQDITSAVKKPKELSKKLTFVIFDIADSQLDYHRRRIKLLGLELDITNGHIPEPQHIVFSTGIVCNSLKDVEGHYAYCMASNLEGTVLKLPEAKYQHNVRSSHMWKYKKTLDGEYKVTSFNLDKNDHPVYTCITPEGLEFKVKRKGTAEERLSDAVIADSNIGKWLTIEYETLSKDNKPLKPVGLSFRDCDAYGNPKH